MGLADRLADKAREAEAKRLAFRRDSAKYWESVASGKNTGTVSTFATSTRQMAGEGQRNYRKALQLIHRIASFDGEITEETADALGRLLVMKTVPLAKREKEEEN